MRGTPLLVGYIKPARFEREQTQLLAYEMEVRRSRRLLGLTTEVDEFKDKCFICQGDLVIDSLTRCSAKTYCCGKVLHKRCLQQELQYSDKCGHCKTSNLRWDEDEKQLLPWEEVVRERVTNATNAIIRYQRRGVPYHIQNPNIVSWRILPYHVNLPIWFEFYTRLTTFVQQRQNATLYIHAYVNLPWMTITQSIRQTVYGMFSRNIPTEVMLCVREVKFRLLFLSWLHYDAEDEVIINRLTLQSSFSPPIYPEDTAWV